MCDDDSRQSRTAPLKADIYLGEWAWHDYAASLSALIDDSVGPQALEIDRTGAFPRREYRRAGQGGATRPHQCRGSPGGRGGELAAADVIERLRRVRGSTAMVLLMHYAATVVVEAHGSDEMRRAIAADGQLGTLAFSEAGSHSHFCVADGLRERAPDRHPAGAPGPVDGRPARPARAIRRTADPHGRGPRVLSPRAMGARDARVARGRGVRASSLGSARGRGDDRSPAGGPRRALRTVRTSLATFRPSPIRATPDTSRSMPDGCDEAAQVRFDKEPEPVAAAYHSGCAFTRGTAATKSAFSRVGHAIGEPP